MLKREIYEELGGEPSYDSLPEREAYMQRRHHVDPDPLEEP